MLTADGADYAQMKKVAEALRQRLLKVKDVTKVNLYGTQDGEDLRRVFERQARHAWHHD